MATTTIPWGDGSGDNIYLTYPSASGDQTVDVSSDANTGAARSKVVTFTSGVGSIIQSLTINQEAVPEQYIVFADPVVEQICANTWGDGVGLYPSQAAAVSSVNTQFAGNTLIEYFDELSYFTGLTSFGQSTTSARCFSGCTNLKSVNIPEGIVTIVGTSASGNYANAVPFRNCSSLERIGFPSTLRNLGQDTSRWHLFDGCTALARVDIPSVNNYLGLSTGNGILCNPFGASTAAQRGLYVNGSLVENITVPSTITSIGKYLFSNNNTIKTVQFHSSLTSIGEGAFRGCSGLTSVTIPLSVTSIGNSAFNGCSNLEGSFNLPNCSAGSYTFQNCSKIVNLTIKTTSATCIAGAGNNTGTAILIGNVKIDINPNTIPTPRFVHYIVKGNLIGQTARSFIRNTATKSLRVSGNCSMAGFGITNVTLSNWEFFELLGVSSSGNLFYGTYGLKSGGIIHFGAEEIAVPISRFGSSSSNTTTLMNRLSKIYVGPGESQAGDQVVLNKYLADSAWSAYSSKLDLWYNYNGEYKTPPTIPSNTSI